MEDSRLNCNRETETDGSVGVLAEKNSMELELMGVKGTI